jgi:hypothetical protein
MPKTEIDYSSTIIYKITCKDASVPHVYVGHTTNFVQRKHAHKQSCINEKTTNYKCKLYEVIRSLGGWANWKMEIVGFFNCANHHEARKKEQEFFVSLNATLNSIEPYSIPKPKIKPEPKIKLFKKKLQNDNIYLDEPKEGDITNTMTGKISKISKFECKLCDYICCKKSEYEKHVLTRKHQINDGLIQKSPKISKYICDICCKEYTFRQGLHVHKQQCISIPLESAPAQLLEPAPAPALDINENLIELLIEEHKDFKNLIIEMMKSNADLQKQMLEVCKNSNTTINNKNSHNKTYNMQIFLNEHCKDAMNIKDFADSFQLQISDFEKVGHLGYVDGISDIIIKKLNEMDVHKRPIHCSDTKRDIIYVHADNVWTKENSDHEQVRLLVQRITAKNIRLIPIWQDLYPNSRNNMHKLNDTYMSLTRQAMGGFGGTIPENETKIIKKIAKTVFIDKNM